MEKNVNAGFSLVEATIVMGLMSGAALMATQMLNQNAKSQAQAQAKSNFTQVINWLSTVVANDSSCASALNLTSGPANNVTYNLSYSPQTDAKQYTSGPFFDADGKISSSIGST